MHPKRCICGYDALMRSTGEPGGYFVTILPAWLPEDAWVVYLRAVAPDGHTVAAEFVAPPRSPDGS